MEVEMGVEGVYEKSSTIGMAGEKYVPL